MFAFRKIITDKLYALSEADDDNDVFNQCFEQWNDTTYLHEFFSNNPTALEYYGMGKKEATKRVIKEAQHFEDELLYLITTEDEPIPLDTIFTALHTTDDLESPYLQSKAFGSADSPSFLRLYAIRLEDGCYIVVAGLIKTARSIQGCEGGPAVLDKLKAVAAFLRENNFEDSYNIAELIL